MAIDWSKNVHTCKGSFVNDVLCNVIPIIDITNNLNKIYHNVVGYNTVHCLDCESGTIVSSLNLIFTDARGSTYTGYKYFNDSETFDNPPLIYMNLESQLPINDTTPVWEVQQLQGLTIQQLVGDSPTFSSTIEFNNFMTENDLVVIKSLQYYDNSNDGNISNENPRTFLAGNQTTVNKYSGVFMPMFRMFTSGWANLIPPVNWTPGNYDLCIPLNYILGSGYVSGTDAQINSAKINCYAPALIMLKAFGHRLVIPSNEQPTGGLQGLTQKLSKGQVYVVTRKKILTDLLDDIGLPYTFDINEALYNNSDSLTGYIPDGQPESGEDNGTGIGDNESDAITLELPSITPINAFNTTYAMTQIQVNNLADYLWNSTWVNDLKLLFNKPIESILSLSLFPVDLTQVGSVSDISMIKIGNVTTDSNGRRLANNYNAVFDMGSIAIEEYFGGFLDYSPHTSLSIYLPYIGIRQLDVAEFMGGVLKVVYALDALTGSFVAMIFADDRLHYQFTGNMGITIPVTGSNANQIASNLMLGAGMLAVGAVTAGVGGAFASGMGAVKGVGGAVQGASGLAIQNSQFKVEKGGLSAPYSALYAPHYCYVIIDRPKQARPSKYANYMGLPSNITATLASVSGYVEVDRVFLENISATDEEKEIIRSLLLSGVIIK